MSTTNVTVTEDWTKVADDTDDPVLVQCLGSLTWEVAAVASDADPVVRGHLLQGPGMAVSRDTIGAGFIYAKAYGSAEALFAVTK